MKLQIEDVHAIAGQLEGNFPGLSSSLPEQPLQQEASRSMILSALLTVTGAAAGKVFLYMVARANSMLQEIEPGQSSDEIMASVAARFRSDFVIPARSNAARVLLLMNAVLEHIQKKLPAVA